MGEWTHINCLDSAAQEKVFDEILQAIMDTPVTSAPNKVGLELAEGPSEFNHPNRVIRTMDEISGGTITFVFERKSASA